MMKTFKFAVVASAAFVAATPLFSQSLGDMQQDMALLKREVGNLRLEVEQLTRQNEALERKIRQMQSSSSSSDLVRSQVASVRSDVSSQNEAMKREIIKLVKKDIESLASQTNDAIEKLAKAIGQRPQASMPTTFSDNYPKMGITYTVKSGDTLGKIARANNSKIKWIQDANKIEDPNRGLRVGESIFIPQN